MTIFVLSEKDIKVSKSDKKEEEWPVKLLVTGFEPFNGGTVNPSEQIVYRLEAPENTILMKKILPVEFGKTTDLLKDLLREYQPDIVLSIGQAGGRAELCLQPCDV